MWRLGRTDTFARTARRYLRRRPHLKDAFSQTLELLEKDPFDPLLHTHDLRGKMKGLHASSVTYQVRLVLKIVKEERTITLIDIGDHDAVYG